MTNGEDILPEHTLEGFVFKNSDRIKYASIHGLPKEAKWIFLTGENGFGKTSVLRSLAENIYEGYLPEDISEHPFLNVTDEELGNVEWGKLSAKEIQQIYRKYDLVLNVRLWKGGQSEPYYSRMRFTKICAYGSSRLDMASENSKQEKSPIKSLFDTQILLRNIEYQLSRWAIKKDSRRDREGEFTTKYEKVTTILKKLLNLKDITVDFKTDKVLYHEKDSSDGQYESVSFHELAAGYRNIISMVGDMILRLFETQPDVYDPAELSGIVIIDELDLHLHPKWQKRLPGLLSEIFPRVQFIASTHSPIPLLGAPEHSVFLKVNRDAENGITVERLEDMEQQISNLLPNTILTSPIFGMREIFPVTHDSNSRIRTEDTYEEIESNQRVAEELKEYLGTDKAKELEKLFKPK